MTRPDPLQLDETGEPLRDFDWYQRGYDAGLNAKPAGLLYWLLGFALAAGVVVGYVFGAMSVAAVPRPGPETSQGVTQGRTGAPPSTAPGAPPRAPASSDTMTAAPRELVGTATWYCGDRCTAGYGPADLVAAAGPELRVGAWRHSEVLVCGPDGFCIVVELVDWCACEDRDGRPTLLDLSSGAFAKLAPLSAGVIPVTVQR